LEKLKQNLCAKTRQSHEKSNIAVTFPAC